VRYDQVNAMLLNEFLKAHQTVQELKEQVAELTAGLQKVSAQLTAASPSGGGLGSEQACTASGKAHAPSGEILGNNR
jgi:hypothetical protein